MKDLINGRIVLFTGTSCQVAGLKQYLGKEYENRLCVDIVCHGVTSPKVWDEYLCWQEEKNKTKVMKVDFRNKTAFFVNALRNDVFAKEGGDRYWRNTNLLRFPHGTMEWEVF